MILSSVSRSVSLIVVGAAFFIGVAVFFSPLNAYGEFQIPAKVYIFFDVSLFIIFLFLLVCFVLQVVRSRALDIISLVVLIFFFFLVVFSLGGLFNWTPSDYIHYFLRNQAYYILFGVVLYNSLLRMASSDINFFLLSLLVLQLIISVFLLALDFFIGGGRFLWEGQRLTGTLVNHNTFGFVMVFFCYWLYFSYCGSFKWALIFVSLAMVILSGSVTAIVGILFLVVCNARLMVPALLIAPLAGFFAWGWVKDLHFVWKLKELFFNESTHLSSLTARQDQFDLFYNSLFDISNWLFGLHDGGGYYRMDSQYYNIYLNTGLFPLFSFAVLAFFVMFKFFRTGYFSFYLWFFVVACSMTAFLSRPNAILLFFFFLAASRINIKEKHESRYYS